MAATAYNGQISADFTSYALGAPETALDGQTDAQLAALAKAQLNTILKNFPIIHQLDKINVGKLAAAITRLDESLN